MASFINTNTASLNAQRNLTTSQSSLATSLQRLSSGLRINSAKDDAAGLAISERFTSQIRGLNQAARNANDGVSLAQTAESALGAVGDNLQRIRELSVQSSNATNSATDRAAINKEVTQLKSEIDRVATQTSFNGTKILDGSFSGASFQVGANAGQTITIAGVTDAQTKSLGSTNFATSTAGTALTNTSTLASFTVNGVAIDNVAAGPTGGTDAAQSKKIVDAINAKYDQTGVYASADSSFKVTLSSTQANTDIVVVGTGPAAAGTISSTPGTGNASTAESAATLDVSSFIGAQRAVSITDAALANVNSGRADLGAIQNRFSTAVTNLQSTSENLSAARSRIQDTDFASETASLTRGQILQQAGTAILAQANSLPNGVLALLRG